MMLSLSTGYHLYFQLIMNSYVVHHWLWETTLPIPTNKCALIHLFSNLMRSMFSIPFAFILRMVFVSSISLSCDAQVKACECERFQFWPGCMSGLRHLPSASVHHKLCHITWIYTCFCEVALFPICNIYRLSIADIVPMPGVEARLHAQLWEPLGKNICLYISYLQIASCDMCRRCFYKWLPRVPQKLGKIGSC